MTLWKTCTLTVPDAVLEVEDETVAEEIVVVDLAEESDNQVTSSMKDTNEVSSDIDNEAGDVVQSSVSAPGFELLVGLLGLFCASKLVDDQ